MNLYPCDVSVLNISTTAVHDDVDPPATKTADWRLKTPGNSLAIGMEATVCLHSGQHLLAGLEVLAQYLSSYSFKSDTYSIGIAALELATGEAPFAGLPVTEVCRI